MFTLEELKALRAKRLEEGDAITAKAKSEGRVNLTAEEDARFDAIFSEVQSLNKQIKFAEAGAEIYAQDEADEARSRAEAEANRARLGVTGTSVEQPDERDKFPTFQVQLKAVMAAARDHTVDRRLQVQAVVQGANEGIGAEGGFLVQTDFAQEILTAEHASSIVASRCREVPISAPSNSVEFNGIDETSRTTGSRWGGVRGYWLAEGGSLTASKPKFRKVKLTLHKLGALVYSTDELLADAAAFESITTQAVGEEFAFLTDDAIIEGDGVGKPLGILSSPCLVAVAKETGQEADTIVAENIINMWSRCWAPARKRAYWYINQAIEPQLFTLGLTLGTSGQPIYMPSGGLSSAPFGTILGRPIEPIEQCSDLGDLGDIILADFSQYALGTKAGIKQDYSIHVEFLTDQGVFRFIKRLDGQPIWASPLTPFKGGASKSLSPFVALAAR